MTEDDAIKNLWGAVLLRAICDAGSINYCIKVDMDQARAYLSTPSRDLQEVCDAAGISYEPFLKTMRAIAKSGWPRASLARFYFATPDAGLTFPRRRRRPRKEAA